MQPDISRVVYNVVAPDIEKTADFYVQVALFQRTFTSRRFICLQSETEPKLEIGIIDETNLTFRQEVKGQFVDDYLSLIVPDVYAALERARAIGAEIIAEPDPLEYEQIRMLVRDPNGVVLDIAAPLRSTA
jgi:predicted enzyme related to lactoylglutathione lyase